MEELIFISSRRDGNVLGNTKATAHNDNNTARDAVQSSWFTGSGDIPHVALSSQGSRHPVSGGVSAVPTSSSLRLCPSKDTQRRTHCDPLSVLQPILPS